ncbi:MAG: hypothetical protein NZM37_11825 [Sandaracinaceae bacterium]|nr:hypothetical protein [Sandaracinaceae bacterium]
MKRQLPLFDEQRARLGRPTIMERALASKYGTPYVHLAAFAIDIDRIYELEEKRPSRLPFGWEVFLTSQYLQARCDPVRHHEMIEESVLSIMEGRGIIRRLGTQLPFAVWLLVHRKSWPEALGACFASWKKPPLSLAKALESLFADPLQPALMAQHCLNLSLDPPIAPTTREALEGMAKGQSLDPFP